MIIIIIIIIIILLLLLIAPKSDRYTSSNNLLHFVINPFFSTPKFWKSLPNSFRIFPCYTSFRKKT